MFNPNINIKHFKTLLIKVMSCLFRSLAPAVGLTTNVLRATIVAFLKTNPILMDDIRASDITEWTDGKKLKDYTASMSNNWQWGGAIEIRAYCELFSVNVCVHVQYTGKKFTINSTKVSRRTVHIRYTGNHFDPMYIQIL